jgi:hypothetical protein
MNTSSHAILSLVIFNQKIRTQFTAAILIRAVLPDIRIFVFYFLMKFVYRLPEKQILSEVYYQPFWQAVVSTFHSIPLALLGILIGQIANWQVIEVDCTTKDKSAVNRCKTCFKTIAVQSTSAAVVCFPKVNLIPPKAAICEYPIANKIGLGLNFPLLQAAPALMPIPAKFN